MCQAIIELKQIAREDTVVLVKGGEQSFLWY